MMDVDVDVQDPLVTLEKFDARKDAIVGVTESGGLHLLPVMKTSTPVDGDLRGATVDVLRSSNGSCAVRPDEVPQALKHRTVFVHIVLLHDIIALWECLVVDGLEELYVVLCVELHQVIPTDLGLYRGHFSNKVITVKQCVSHSDSVGLHGVVGAVVIVPNEIVIEVGHLLLPGLCFGGHLGGPVFCPKHKVEGKFGSRIAVSEFSGS
mmetsp:Transcript_26103/g.51229  ORF Transcript_26103/g.51229 Transcript_26103/m.51229 type:complete len:208 (-) Transcript_26103:106-729(-)